MDRAWCLTTPESMTKRLGIIQSRGLGDLIIALPIADYYRKQGWAIYWPIDQQFLPSMKTAAPWVHWIPLEVDAPGRYFYDIPRERLKNFKCNEILCLYQALSTHPEWAQRPEFQIVKFDQAKYILSHVPFEQKWQLADCIQRDTEREQQLRQKILGEYTGPYCLVHLEGSTARAAYDPSWIPENWQTVEITPITDNIFDWLTLLEGAEAIIAIDSVIANLVDQLKINHKVDSYFIPRSHIQLTPVMNGPWTYLQPDPQTQQRIQIFR